MTTTSIPVPTRRFGRTELAMPVLSCGGMRYQHSWKDVDQDEIPRDNQANLAAIIHRAVDLGIYHIETARGYGTSEIQLGEVLGDFSRDELIVQTKVGPRDTGKEFREVVETSLGNLRLDHVDLLAIHGINNADLLDQSLRPGGSLDMARNLKREGICRSIGFSTHAPVEVIVRAIETDAFDYVNLHWYFVFQENEPAIQAATRHDMGVFIISPSDKGGRLYEPSPKLAALCQPLTPMAFNDLFCLACPRVHTLSIGAAKPSDFDEHMEALHHYDQAEKVSAPVAERLQDEMLQVHGRDWLEEGLRGVPPWEDIPGQVNVREIVRLWNLATALDITGYAKARYNLLGQADHWFPGQTADKLDETAFRHILGEHPFADRLIEVLRDAHQRFAEAPKKRLSESSP